MDPLTPNKRRLLPGVSEDETDVTRAPAPWDDKGDSIDPASIRPGSITAQTGAVTIDDSYDLRKGTSLGEYRIEGRIGQGGMGVVYSAVHPVIGKRAAIKILKRELCTDPTNLERFMTEARVVNEIGHPNIVDIFAFGEMPDGRCYFVMEWLKGETLRDAMSRGKLTIEEMSAILKPLTRALEAAHAKKIIHRDLKPDNIFLAEISDDRPKVKLLDFGIAKLGRSDQRIERTATGAIMGTPQYIAPEQAKGYTIDHRADIYALGGILFEMLTGRPPFVADNAMEVVAKHLMEAPVTPSEIASDVPPALDKLVLEMLSKDPAQRPTLAQIRKTIDEAKREIGAELSVEGVPGLAARASSESFQHLPRPLTPISGPLSTPFPVGPSLTPPPGTPLAGRSSSPALSSPFDVPSRPSIPALEQHPDDSASRLPSEVAEPPRKKTKLAVVVVVAAVAAVAVGAFFVVNSLAKDDTTSRAGVKAVDAPTSQQPAPGEPGELGSATPDVDPEPPKNTEKSPGVDTAPKPDPKPVAPVKKGKLTIYVRGAANASVFVDNQLIGSGTTFERQLPFGEHVVEVRAPGMIVQKRVFDIGKTPAVYRVTLVAKKPGPVDKKPDKKLPKPPVDPTDANGLIQPGTLPVKK